MQDMVIDLGSVPDKLEYNRGVISFATFVTKTYEDAGVTITMSKGTYRVEAEPKQQKQPKPEPQQEQQKKSRFSSLKKLWMM